ncbi:hypothetical protein ANCDUO_21448, partial [Ancylostoma duodenale]
ALSPAASASPQRGPDLNAFLSSQVQRHRKRQRQRSPTSPSTLIKKLKMVRKLKLHEKKLLKKTDFMQWEVDQQGKQSEQMR